MLIKKHIWIVNEYAGTPLYGMDYRNYYFAKEFVNRGCNVSIIGSSYSHLFRKYPMKKRENIDGIDFFWIKTFNYGESHSYKRVVKWFLFTFKLFFLSFVIKKPDVIIVSPMAPLSIFPLWIFSKLYKAKLVYEVKDIWPLTLVELKNLSERNPLVILLSICEKFAIKKSDIIVSNLKNYGQYLKNILNVNKPFIWISNGIDLQEIQNTEVLPDFIKNQIPKDKFTIGYTGTVGFANALDIFCEAAKLVSNDEDKLFIIVGQGQERNNLQNKYSNLKNLLFIDSIDKKQIQSMLALFDVCYIGLKKENLFKYGVSPNKLFEYMYSAKPILYAIESGKNNLIDIANCGICIEAENPRVIVDSIDKLYNMSENKRKFMGDNGKEYVLKYLTYEKLAQEYIDQVVNKI